MAKTFDKAIELVERIPNIELTKWFIRSLVLSLHPEDQETVVEDLLDNIEEKQEVVLK